MNVREFGDGVEEGEGEGEGILFSNTATIMEAVLLLSPVYISIQILRSPLPSSEIDFALKSFLRAIHVLHGY